MNESNSDTVGQGERSTQPAHSQDLLAILDAPESAAPAAAASAATASTVEAEIPDRLTALLELACDQQLQIASKLEEILELMNGPSEEGILDKLAQLLAPIANDTAIIKQHLGAA